MSSLPDRESPHGYFSSVPISPDGRAAAGGAEGAVGDLEEIYRDCGGFYRGSEFIYRGSEVIDGGLEGIHGGSGDVFGTAEGLFGSSEEPFGSAEGIAAFSNSQDLPSLPIDQTGFDFLNLFMDFKLADVLGKAAYLRVGRQELLFGSQRLVSNLDWANTRRTGK